MCQIVGLKIFAIIFAFEKTDMDGRVLSVKVC